MVMVGLALVLLVGSTWAGGAAAIVLDELPTEVRAGEPLHLTFTVWQHGRHRVDEFDGVDLQPLLVATHQETGERVQAQGYKAENTEVGHFSVDVTFPTAGTWEWKILPEPFALLNEFVPLTVLEAAPAATSSAPTAGATGLAAAEPRLLLRLGGAMLLGLALVVAVTQRRRQAAPQGVTVLQP